jgi:hypothetical protein
MDYDKAKYMEGAVWMGKRLTNEVERLCQAVDSLVREFSDREAERAGYHHSTTSFGNSTEGRNGQWLVIALKKATVDLYEQAITMLESAILNMEDAQERVDQVLLQHPATAKADS